MINYQSHNDHVEIAIYTAIFGLVEKAALNFLSLHAARILQHVSVSKQHI